ncbi:MAG: chromosome segregation ATPase [Candidatus Nanohaloarchaea archaeon]|jgi:chromosome segregation ATPase
MDLLGKKGEEAVDELTDVEERVKTLESHLNAVDSALQDFVDNYQSVLTDEMNYQEEELDRLREVIRRERFEEDEVDDVKKRLRRLETKISEIEEGKEDSLERILYTVKDIRRNIKDSKEDISALENRLDDLESEFYMYRNNKEYDFEKKLDERDYRDEKKKMEQEIARLRTSVRALADEIDEEDKIEIE